MSNGDVLDPNFAKQMKGTKMIPGKSTEENSALKIAREMERQRKLQEQRLRKIGA